ncbi:MtrAB system histidine kinase MtrB [Georgenia sp. Z1344]|uniref:MtrAB system histidine kinase MtrB n=1 Tax=Georgenia sp. Z1344 TaxID=3416706 RepID=UPI003CEFBE37
MSSPDEPTPAGSERPAPTSEASTSTTHSRPSRAEGAGGEVPEATGTAGRTPARPARKRSWRARLRRRAFDLARRWRGSLAVRVVTVTAIGGMLGLGIIGAVVSVEIRDRLFDARVEQVVGDAADRAARAQATLDDSLSSTPSEAQQAATDIVDLSQGAAPGVIGTVITRDEEHQSGPTILEPTSSAAIRDVISAEMHAAVEPGASLHWQSATVSMDGEEVPAIVVGAPVVLPVAGEYELYTVYGLQPEQQMIAVVTSVLGVAALALVALVAAIAALVLRWVLRPVRQASRTAERLAAGLLDERMDVSGSDEVARLGESFNEMADSLQQQIKDMSELSRLQQRFVSDVSHELRTPLTTIRMAADLIHDQRDEFPPPVRRSAELLVAQIERFDHMLADLLEISRFDAGAATLEVGPTDLGELVEGVVEGHILLAESKGTEVRVHRVTPVCIAEVDARRIERVLRNLLVNAIEHSEGRPVDLTVAADDRSVAVLVRDHGVGMSEEQADRVFDRFWRGDTARTRTTGGTGLGLSIAQEDVGLHGGTLAAAGRPGEGAAFLLTLPREDGGEVGPSPIELWPDDASVEPALAAPLVGLVPPALDARGEER